jgi:hypothetical protein
MADIEDCLYKIEDTDSDIIKDLKRKQNVKVAELMVLIKKIDSLREEINKHGTKSNNS